MTEEFKQELSSLLSTIYTDAEMAINGEWDKSDEGFEVQQNLIKIFCYKHNIPLVIEDEKEEEEENNDC